LFTKKDQEDIVVALNVEIKEIEKSLVNIRKKVGLIVSGHHNYANDF
jgi:hypothetical protein